MGAWVTHGMADPSRERNKGPETCQKYITHADTAGLESRSSCHFSGPVICLPTHIYHVCPPPTFKEQKKLTYQLLEGGENVV